MPAIPPLSANTAVSVSLLKASVMRSASPECLSILYTWSIKHAPLSSRFVVGDCANTANTGPEGMWQNVNPRRTASWAIAREKLRVLMSRYGPGSESVLKKPTERSLRSPEYLSGFKMRLSNRESVGAIPPSSNTIWRRPLALSAAKYHRPPDVGPRENNRFQKPGFFFHCPGLAVPWAPPVHTPHCQHLVGPRGTLLPQQRQSSLPKSLPQSLIQCRII